MARDPPPSDSESDGFTDAEEYQYESEGEERLAVSARDLMRETDGNYRLARAAILAYTRPDISFISASHPRALSQGTVTPPHTPARSRTRPPPHTPLPTPQTPSRTRSRPAKVRTTVGLPTPPPTAVDRRTIVRSTTPMPTGVVSVDPPHSVDIPQPQPAIRREGRRQELPPIPQSEFTTLIYPHLLATGMLDYFRIHDGVSRHTGDVVRSMLRRIKADPDWLGDISYVDTSAVTSIANQHIHHPGAVASDIWYTVSVGTRVGIFVSWHDAGPYVKDIKGSIYRSWSHRADAFSTFQHALISKTVRLIPSS